MAQIADVLSIDRPSGRLGVLLSAIPRHGFEHHWEGEFTGLRGAAQGCEIRVRVRIGFYGDSLEGAGRAINFPADTPESDTEVTLSGSLDGDAVTLQMWFANALIGREAFVSTGVLSSDGREMAGDWSAGCFNPETCGCAGAGGAFLLKRID